MSAENRWRTIPESALVPMATTDLTGAVVIAIAPHPDDESFGCGGALTLHRASGDPVKVVFLTDGASGDERGEYGRNEYVALRRREAMEACAVLGVADTEFWEIPDRSLVADTATVRRLATLIERYAPTLVYAPSPLEFHPDHVAAATLVWRAVHASRVRLSVAFYEVNRPINVNTLVDISPVVEVKTRACNAYQTQLANRPYTDFIVGLNRYRALTVASSCTHAEGYVVEDALEIRQGPVESFARKQLLALDPPNVAAPPLVSIVVRTRDRRHLLCEALESVVSQTYPNVEVIVVNDGGEDVSDIVERFRPYLSVHYRSHETPAGRSAAANTGLTAARGAYVNFLDDDDRLYADHVARLVAFLQTTGEQVAYSDCEIGKYVHDGERYGLVGERSPFCGNDFDRDQLFLNNYIPIMTVMFTRELAERVGPFDETFEILEDWDFWIRLSENVVFHRVPGITAEYRVFDRPLLDYSRWSRELFKKHHGGSQARASVASVLSRIDRLQIENARLRSLLAEQREELRGLKRALNAWRRPLLGRIRATRMVNRMARLSGRFVRRVGLFARNR